MRRWWAFSRPRPGHTFLCTWICLDMPCVDQLNIQGLMFAHSLSAFVSSTTDGPASVSPVLAVAILGSGDGDSFGVPAATFRMVTRCDLAA